MGEKTCVSSISSAIEAGSDALGLSDSKSLKESYDLLVQWRKEGEILIYTGPVLAGGVLNTVISEPYESILDNLVIQNMDLIRDSGTAIEFSIELKQVDIPRSTLSRVELPESRRATSRSGATPTEEKSVEGPGNSTVFRAAGL